MIHPAVIPNDGRSAIGDKQRETAIKSMWRERGYLDAKKGRPKLSRERLLQLGGQEVVSLYFQGYRCWR